VIKHTLTPADEFILVACDGLWGKFPYEEAVTYVRLLSHLRLAALLRKHAGCNAPPCREDSNRDMPGYDRRSSGAWFLRQHHGCVMFFGMDASRLLLFLIHPSRLTTVFSLTYSECCVTCIVAARSYPPMLINLPRIAVVCVSPLFFFFV
jgi:hypothetical protein